MININNKDISYEKIKVLLHDKKSFKKMQV